MPAAYIPVLIFALIVLSFPVLALLIFKLIRPESRGGPAKFLPYECGIPPESNARGRYSARFYVVAMLFVIFDVETIFVLAWAIAFRELGWFGYFGVLVFIILLVVVLIYEWRNGALDFGPDGKKILAAYRKLTRKTAKK